MIRWIIIGIALFLVYRLVRRFFQGKVPSAPKAPAQIQDEMVQDPVCLTYVPKRMAVKIKSPLGEETFFCSPACRDRYIAETEEGRIKEKRGKER